MYQCLQRDVLAYAVPCFLVSLAPSGGSNLENTPTTFHYYIMRGRNLDGALEKACNTIKYVFIALENSLNGCLKSFAAYPLLTSIATIVTS